MSTEHGPLALLAGVWQGNGEDISPGGRPPAAFIEQRQYELRPGVFNRLAEQWVYPLRYYSRLTDSADPTKQVHEETGYWLWVPSSTSVLQLLAVPRGVSILSGGNVTETSGTYQVVLEADLGRLNLGILNAPPYDEVVPTKSVRTTVQFNATQLAYEQRAILSVPSRGGDVDHIDRATLLKVS